MIDPVALRQWLDSLAANDPIRVAFEAGNDSLASSLGNAKTETGARLIPIGEFSQWLTTSGIRFKLQAAERSEATPASVKDLIEVVFGLERNPHISVADPSAATMIVDGLLEATVVNAADAAAFDALKTTAVSPIEKQFGQGTSASPDDFGQARKVGQ